MLATNYKNNNVVFRADLNDSNLINKPSTITNKRITVIIITKNDNIQGGNENVAGTVMNNCHLAAVCQLQNIWNVAFVKKGLDWEALKTTVHRR